MQMFIRTLLAAPLVVAVAMGAAQAVRPQAAQAETMPQQFAGDPVAKVLGPEIMTAALREGRIMYYAGTRVGPWLAKTTQKKNFEDRFGIKLDILSVHPRELLERVLTEHATGRKVADIMQQPSTRALLAHESGVLEKWRLLAPGLDGIDRRFFLPEIEGYWWPYFVSEQGICYNPKLVSAGEVPRSYRDLLKPKWRGKVASRDPRQSGGGAWQMLSIYHHPDLGMEYLQQLHATVAPRIIPGGSRVTCNAVLRGEAVVALNARTFMLAKLPSDAPLKMLAPKEGLSWLAIGNSLIKGAPHPNAAKVLLTWLYELERMQDFTDRIAVVPHPAMKVKPPRWSLATAPWMSPIPVKDLRRPNWFFKKMEKLYGIR